MKKTIFVLLFSLLAFAGCFDFGSDSGTSDNDEDIFSLSDLFDDSYDDDDDDDVYEYDSSDEDDEEDDDDEYLDEYGDYDIDYSEINGHLEDEDENESFFSGIKKKIDNFNAFSVEEDIELGKQCAEEIESSPSDYPILSRKNYASVYKYLETIRDRILSSDKIENRDNFEWKVTIIDDDVLNAFVTPGGYIYFYTGLLKYMKSEAEVAGVMAHEIAHADRRHSTQAMTKEYGVTILFSIATGLLTGGEGSFLADIVQTLAVNGASLSFSRKHEYEADEYSVRYLNSIRNKKNYQPTAIVDFFDRMKADSLSQSNGHFEFLMTHPYDDNRKANIYKIWQKLGAPEGDRYENNHAAIVAKLP